MSTQVTVERPPAVHPRLPKELLANAAFLLARMGFVFKARAIEEVEAAGFSLYDYSVLAVLAEEARKTQATIADALAVDRSQLVGILDALEEGGLVERKRDPVDRRRHLVTLTPEGRKQLGRLRTIIGRLQDEFLAPLSGPERETLHELVLKLACHHDPRCAFGGNGGT